MTDNITAMVNHLLSNLWVFILLGFAHLIFIERVAVQQFIQSKNKRKNKTLLEPLAQRGLYLVGGFVLVWSAYALTQWLVNLFMPSLSTDLNLTAVQPTNFWALMHYQAQFVGVLSMIGFIAAGIALMLSAGTRWLVTVAKALSTLVVLYILFSIAIALL